MQRNESVTKFIGRMQAKRAEIDALGAGHEVTNRRFTMLYMNQLPSAYWREKDPSRLARALGVSNGNWKLSFERKVGTGVRGAIASLISLNSR